MLRYEFHGGLLDGYNVGEDSTGNEKQIFDKAHFFTEGRQGHHFNEIPKPVLEEVIKDSHSPEEKVDRLQEMMCHRYTVEKKDHVGDDDVITMAWSTNK
ncbi:hypothetical protein FYZ48_21390 [Gimesia chilikensis]|uniref:hypothetical protein n=1 Tax=Gimesia chilikensis TaxID=2605989 RepID=UPI0011EDC1AD|nr:hypothetical protein [Gimesia chilikensis]KAA0134148.1 hypothetical protein FYZ48_21390 [Gimesia chilikensis]